MDSFTQQRLDQDAGWRLVLSAYLDASAVAEATEPARATPPVDADDDDPDGTDLETESEDSSAGWIPRVDDIPGVAAESLPRLHGRLIAFGLLKFQLANATTGVVYRVTPKGRRFLETSASETDESAVRPAA